MENSEDTLPNPELSKTGIEPYKSDKRPKINWLKYIDFDMIKNAKLPGETEFSEQTQPEIGGLNGGKTKRKIKMSKKSKRRKNKRRK
jgi:hypothetical protein